MRIRICPAMARRDPRRYLPKTQPLPIAHQSSIISHQSLAIEFLAHIRKFDMFLLQPQAGTSFQSFNHLAFLMRQR